MNLHNLKHGDKLECPTCCMPGKLDTEPGNKYAFEDSIWFNEFLGWECVDCVDK
jgi:hypothetical protein